MSRNEGNKTFVRITNNDILKEIRSIGQKLETHMLVEGKKLDEIKEHAIETNGKVKLNRWMSTTAITMLTAMMGWILVYSLK